MLHRALVDFVNCVTKPLLLGVGATKSADAHPRFNLIASQRRDAFSNLRCVRQCTAGANVPV